MLAIQYTLSKQDYVNFYTYMYWDVKEKRRARLRNIVKHAIFFLLFCSVFFFSGLYGRLNSLLSLVFLAFFANIFIPLLTGKANLVSEAENVANNPDNFSIFSETNLSFLDTSIDMKNDIVQSTLKWQAILKKVEVKDYYYLYLNAMQAIIIPKRAFKNNDEKNTFDKILSRNLSLEAEIKDALQ
jgi:hypothetical protein